uniref:Early nodulin-like protein 3 n=2 Tax=Zea mays TaxID=4577 RepID=B6TWI8_MAIZE|nr:early nodulin-like protein 3 precursor [Zea mays]|eukprot:NP_001151061.1 early nodulin-like protein 3 precursor [Zea mays]
MAQGRMSCVFLACLVAVASVSASTASAFVFKAGGTGEWRVPAAAGSGNGSAYNAWAQRNRFRVGDAIAFTYQPGNDSVLLVDKRSYDACDTGSPTDTFADGSTVFTFTRSGPFYFISGNKDNCDRGEKLIVVVMAERAAVGNATEPGAGLAPSPSGPFSSFSPPPPFGIDISPTAAYPPPNAAPPKVAAGVAGAATFAIGALFYALV